MTFRPAVACPRPDAFAVVMATGIVSTSAAYHHFRWLGTGLLIVAAGVFVVLVGAATVHRFAFGDLRSADVTVRLFTFVAACAVMAAALERHPAVMWPLAASAVLAWLPLSVLTARNMWRQRRRLRRAAHGSWELVSVATSGLAILGADLSLRGMGWLWWLAAALLACAIAIYTLMTVLVVTRAAAARFDPGGFEPDSWIMMGGLAIATLAGAHLHRSAVLLGWPVELGEVVLRIIVTTWICALLWIQPLVYFSVRRNTLPHRLFPQANAWWAMVFPLGMFSAATYAVSSETGWQPLKALSLVFFWIALSSWFIVAAADLRSLRSRVRLHDS